MISQCANPDCAKSFDYREGRFYRFRQVISEGEQRANAHCVLHFWLCGSCSEKYTLQARSRTFEIRPKENGSLIAGRSSTDPAATHAFADPI
jgi:hypothetical protein